MFSSHQVAPASAHCPYLRTPSVAGSRVGSNLTVIDRYRQCNPATKVAFVCEDDIFIVNVHPAASSPPLRLTVDHCCEHPVLSNDGSLVAYTNYCRGQPEVFVVPATGGPSVQVTFFGAPHARAIAWTPDDSAIFLSSNERQVHPFCAELYTAHLARTGDRDVSPHGSPVPLNLGPADALSFSPERSRFLLGRHTFDPAMAEWKRYKGGRFGEVWMPMAGEDADQKFWLLPILDADGKPLHVGSPMWLHDRVYFVADTLSCTGNIFSVCAADGKDLQQHTHHTVHYARCPRTDGVSIVYQCGGDLFCFNTAENKTQLLSLPNFRPSHVARRVKPVSNPAASVDHVALHPTGHSMALVARGRVFEMALWEGPAIETPLSAQVLKMCYLCDGRMLMFTLPPISVSLAQDGNCDPQVWVQPSAVTNLAAQVSELRLTFPSDSLSNIGLPELLEASPDAAKVAFTNHKLQLLMMKVRDSDAVVHLIDSAPYQDGIQDINWSPDGKLLAYVKHLSSVNSVIFIHTVAGAARGSRAVTCGRFRDTCPSFDRDMKFLFFVSGRSYLPVADELHFNMGFPRAQRVYLLTLHKDTASPFLAAPRRPGTEDDDDDHEADDDGSDNGSEDDGWVDEAEAAPIDFDGICHRVEALPVPTGSYFAVKGLSNGQLMYVRADAQDLASSADAEASVLDSDDDPPGTLFRFHLAKKRETKLHERVDDVCYTHDAQVMCLAKRTEDGDDGEIRVFTTGTKARETDSDDEDIDEDAVGEDSGLVDFNSRASLDVDPLTEWHWMLCDVWLNLHHKFWDASMNGVNWRAVLAKYSALLPRVSTRTDFGDVLHEMTTELGSSHLFQTDGDFGDWGREIHRVVQGYLGAESHWDAEQGGYVLDAIVRGESWDTTSRAPLHTLGANVSSGDVLMAINRVRLTPAMPPHRVLAGKANMDIFLTLQSAAVPRQQEAKEAPRTAQPAAQPAKRRPRQVGGKSASLAGRNKKDGADASASPAATPLAPRLRQIRVRACDFATLAGARYRDWVHANQAFVHKATSNQIGYLHIRDMEATGFADFHRYFLVEGQKNGLIVDVRWNLGGHVSSLLVEKLTQRILGWAVGRHGEPMRFPEHAISGPLVLLVDENTCSDGEIIADTFARRGLGTIIGRRTWGGIVSMMDQELVDGTSVTVPMEIYDVTGEGIRGLENVGVAPAIEVFFPPHDYRRCQDPQLQRAVAHLLDCRSDVP